MGLTNTYNLDQGVKLEAAHLQSILARLSGTRAAVFGDYCLDAYWLLEDKETEISVETGLPIRRVREQRYSLGGAGNVVANLIDLGVGSVQAIGAVGADLFGGEVLRLLKSRGADTGLIAVLEEPWQTMVYAKPCMGEIESNRLDFGGFNRLSGEAETALFDSLNRAAAENDVVILNQQVPAGLANPDRVMRLNEVIERHPGTCFVVDARLHAKLYRNAVLKLNAREASTFLDEPVEEKQITEVAAMDFVSRIFRQTGKPVFLTRGENGIVFSHAGGVEAVPGIQILERTDPVGAGDTTVAVLAAVLGSGGDPWIAAAMANVAASVTVRKLQTTGSVTPQELLAAAEDLDFVYRPELADDPRHARFIPGTEFEQIGDIPDDLEIRHAIFDHDGTISTLRQGWELVMEPMMVRAVLGPCFEAADVSLYQRVQDAVRTLIEKTTGIQTLVQMQGLVRLVAQFGCVVEADILDANGYKQIFNDELMKLVRRRTEKLDRGELASDDFQIKNAELLLRRLHGKGVKLYLASGTDEADVIAEATAMGYADLFEGRIFGSVGDVKVEAKKVVLERIIRENGLSGRHFATFGDGPVEIRETRKRGGMCVGIASDEVRRFGANPAKRSRLVRAGANLIVPDFSQLDALLRVLQLS